MSEARKRLDRDYFERLYAEHPDPWGFETSDYESRKYGRTLAALGGRGFENALEVGCSIGVFTGLLAGRCEALLAVDASERAVEAARRRLTDERHVRVERATLPEETPEGDFDRKFDLIVASEVLYYLPEETMLATLGRLEDALSPGGLFVIVHWREETRTYPLQGDEVHRLVRENTSLRHLRHEAEPEYLLDVYKRDGERP
ncbi:MAG: class I SAM-dependent DNA methyltransferase [Rubrobacter sp.]